MVFIFFKDIKNLVNSEYDTDVCERIDNFCPLSGGETIQMKLRIKLDSLFGGAIPSVTFRVVDDSGANIFCFKTDIKVVN